MNRGARKTFDRISWRMRGAVAALALIVAAPAAAGAQGIAGPYLGAKQAEQRGDVAAAAEYFARALARDEDNLALLERTMLNQLASGQVQAGIALARRFHKVQPNHYMGVLALAAEALKGGEPARVRDLLSPESPFVAQIIEAWAAFDAGALDDARALLTRLEGSSANGASGQIVAAYHLGLMEAAMGNDQVALDALTRAADRSNGGTLRLVEAQAGALARMNRPEDAAKVIADRLAGTYGDVALETLGDEILDGAKPGPIITEGTEGAAEALFGVSGLLSRSRNRLGSLAYAQLAVFLDPALNEAQLLIARILDQSEQYQQAIEAYRAIPDGAPETLSARIGEAEVLQAADQADEGIEAMRETVEQFPDALEAYTALGGMLRRERRFEEAAVAYDGAIKLLDQIEPHHWGLFYQRGISRERSKQWDLAEADFRKALELEPDQPDVLNYLGYSLVELGRNLEEAEEMIEKAVAQRPEDGYIVDSLGWVLYRFGEFERAVKHLEKAVELRPVDPVINDHFGDALWMVGRRTEAIFQWRRALSFDPEEKDAERIRRKLKVGLDKVLEEEKAEGLPGIIGRNGESKTGKDGG